MRSRLAIQPRCLSREEAAAYCGLGPEGFAAWVRAGRMPGPIPGTHRWDRRAIDVALDKLSGLEKHEPQSELDQWFASHESASRGAA